MIESFQSEVRFMSQTSEILILAAHEKYALIFTLNDGVSRLLRSIEYVLPECKPEDHFNPLHIPCSNQHLFACELMMALVCDVHKHPYEGVIIMADGAMMEELRSVQTSAISRLLITHIVREPSAHGAFTEQGAANALTTYRGELH